MAMLINVSSMLICTIYPVTVVIVWIVVIIAMVPTVNVARRTFICAKIAIVFIAVVILWVHVHCSVIPRANVNVNPVLLAINVIVVKPIIISLAHMVVNPVAVMLVAPLAICHLVIQKREFVIAKIMWRANVVMSKYSILTEHFMSYEN